METFCSACIHDTFLENSYCLRLILFYFAAVEEEKFIILLNQLAETRPASGMTGLYYHDSPACAAFSSGSGQFLWFADMSKLLEFLRNHAHDLAPGPMYLDHAKLKEQAAHFIDRAIEGDLPMEALINQLNIALEGFVEIDWMGQFEDLVLSLDDFPVLVRQDFFESIGIVACENRVIGNDQVGEFTDFLTDYGV